ncbi:MAG: hydrogenase maturation protease [Ignavibacteriaceae bacterium]|jgi:hydrogenase maturation protease|nr:hydrogenase maturation protease [Ignavibacteriaceae bacterium]
MEILILGIGNILMGDEGIGVHAIRYMEKQKFSSNIRLLDGGTGGFHLLEYFQEYKNIIMIDATMDGNPPGTIRLITPKFSNDFPKVLSSHDIGLKDLVESAALLDTFPIINLITVSIEKIQPMLLTLSTEVENAIPAVYEKVKEVLGIIENS